MLFPEEEGTQRAGPCASWGQDAWCLIPGGVVRPGAPIPALWQCQCSLAGSLREVCLGPPCPPAPGVSAYLPEALQLGALPLGPGMGTGLAGFATPMSCEKSGSSGRAGRRRQCCPVLDPPPNSTLPSVLFPTFLREAAQGTGKQSPGTPRQHVTVGKPLIGPQCFHLSSGTLGSSSRKQPHPDSS